MKRILFVAALSIALVMAMGGVAFANFGPHGGYDGQTDACAGCHRAHTSFSSVARTVYDWSSGSAVALGPGAAGSALLVSSATNMRDFCYACHGEGAPGASTNVQYGIFDSGPSASTNPTTTGGEVQLYQTNSSFGAALNGGGFQRIGGTANVGSAHDMEGSIASSVTVWGLGNSAAAAVKTGFTCTSCHDPHGDANYRLLKAALYVNGSFGGYTAADVPQPWVISAEEGFPAAGFPKHVTAASIGYKPNYTTPEYRYTGNVNRSMSGWCAGCHEQYSPSANSNYGGGSYMTSAYNYGAGEEASNAAGTFIGSRTRHRHPINVNLQTGNPASGGASLGTAISTPGSFQATLPLEMAFSKDPDVNRGGTQDYNDVLGCLTCHFAHGSSATMTGWAAASYITSPSAIVTWFPQLVNGRSGVNPNNSQALLRANNRGVCEQCHNK